MFAPEPELAEASSFPRGWALWAPLGAGALLRFAGLSRQILGGDEMHPLRAALSTPLWKLLTTYQAPDTYPPFAGLCRLVLELGGTLDERWLRLPGLVAGLLLIWLLPHLAAPLLGRSTAQLAGWTLALAPPLVLYSRIVRAYAPLTLLVGAAALLFYRWLVAPTVRRATAYVVLATVAVVLHPVAGPAAVAPLAFGGGLLLVDRELWRRRRRGLVAVGAALLGALVLALVPARESLAELVSTRRVEPHYSWETARSALVFDAGVTHGAAALGVWALMAWSWWRLFRRQPRFAAFSLWMFLAPIAGVIVLSPVGAGEPLLFNRYVLVGLPFALLWLSAGLAELGARAQQLRSPRAAVAVVAALLVGWVALGPFAEPSRWTSSFAHHNDFVTYPCPRPTLAAEDVPLPYRQLAVAGGNEAVVEYPWSPVWRMGRALYLYQGIHARQVFVGSPEPMLADPNVHLDRVIAGTPAAFRASGARFVIVHLDPRQEEMRLRDAACGAPTADRWSARTWTGLAELGQRMAATLESRWGKPTWSDATVRVWDLKTVRRSMQDPQ